MISYQQALDLILSHPFKAKEIAVSIENADGKVLAEDIIADRDLPPFDRVTMDGIAIDFSSFQKGQRRFEIEKTIGAGMPKSNLEDPSKCVQIMTGAIMPNRADTVIRYEDLEIIDNHAAIITEEIQAKQNVHFKGQDKKQGEVVLKKGTLLGSAELIVAAAVGKSKIKVFALPKTAIITTGDELVDVTEQPLPHQIRRSSNYGVQSVLQRMGMAVDQFHLNDDKAAMTTALSSILTQYELLIITGGVSRGKFDFLPEILEHLGVEKHFHKVKQKPGKPFWFGTAPNGSTVFALPGNPVSSFVCALAYIKPWVYKSLKLPVSTVFVQLATDVSFPPALTYFLECELKINSNAVLEAKPFKGNGSGDFANMIQADGFVVLPEDQQEFKAGEIYPFISYRNIV